MENVSEPDFDISSSIDTAKVLPLSKPQSSATPDVKKSNRSKLVSYEICFPDFYFSSVIMGGFVKYVVGFLMEMQVIELPSYKNKPILTDV